MQDAKNLKDIQQRIYPPMVEGDHTFGTVSDKIGDVTLKKKTPFHWFIGFGIAFMVAQLLLFSVVTLLAKGIGIWGNNQPVGWAFDIINFVWWIGIGHAGTLISAILLTMPIQDLNYISLKAGSKLEAWRPVHLLRKPE